MMYEYEHSDISVHCIELSFSLFLRTDGAAEGEPGEGEGAGGERQAAVRPGAGGHTEQQVPVSLGEVTGGGRQAAG